MMTYSFARVSATLGMDVKDVFSQHHRLWLRLHEKGGKVKDIPCHHNLETHLREYIEAAGLEEGPLFRNDDAKLEHAQQLAGHSDPKTTLLYDRRSDEISLDEAEKIGI